MKAKKLFPDLSIRRLWDKMNEVENDVDKKIEELNSNLPPFQLGIDEDGNYGYIKEGADSVTPFKSFKFNKIYQSSSYVNTLNQSGLNIGKQYLIIMTSYSSSGSSTAYNSYCVISSITGGIYTEVCGISDQDQGASRIYLVTTTSDTLKITCKADTCLFTIIE